MVPRQGAHRQLRFVPFFSPFDVKNALRKDFVDFHTGGERGGVIGPVWPAQQSPQALLQPSLLRSSVQMDLCRRIQKKGKAVQPADMVHVQMAQQDMHPPYPLFPQTPSQLQKPGSRVEDHRLPAAVHGYAGGIAPIFQKVPVCRRGRSPHAPYLYAPCVFHANAPVRPVSRLYRISSRQRTSKPSFFPFSFTVSPREVVLIRSPASSATARDM